MKMATINEAARELRVTRQRINRAITAGALHPLQVGSRGLIDIDEARRVFGPPPADAVEMEELAQITGLTTRAIRRGMAEGWLPWVQDGRRKKFDVNAVCAAMERRMLGTDKT